MSDLTDRTLGGLYGLLVGDMLGVPFEFHEPDELPPVDEIDIQVPSWFRRAHPDAPEGAWSDDGAHALCLLASLLDCGELNTKDLARRLVDWQDRGTLAVQGVVFDIGIQTSTALAALRAGTPAEQAGPRAEQSNGNGSLMRVLPLALWHKGSDEALIADAARQSLITHGHERSQICCALYCMWARATLLSVDAPWQAATAAVRLYARHLPTWQIELAQHIMPEAPAGGSGSGYVVDCLHTARLAIEQSSFASTIRHAIAVGHDTDTTAAVAGGIAGLRYGLSGIPQSWLDHLAEEETVARFADRLLHHITSAQ